MRVFSDLIDDDDAVSEIIGQILMTGIVVLAFGIIAVSSFSMLGSVEKPHVDVDGWSNEHTDTINVRHSGGEVLDTKDLKFILDVNGTKETYTSSEIKDDFYNKDTWGLSDIISVNVSQELGLDLTNDDYIEFTLVHIESSTVIESGMLGSADTIIGGDDGDESSAGGIKYVDGSVYKEPGNKFGFNFNVTDGPVTITDVEVSVDGVGIIDDTNTLEINGNKPPVEDIIGDNNGFYLKDPDLANKGAEDIDVTFIFDDGSEKTFSFSSPDAEFTYTQVEDKEVEFDASGSTSPNDIEEYNWDFGDGNVENTSNPVITHAYDTEDSYTVELTVVDSGNSTDTATKEVGVTGAESPSINIRIDDLTHISWDKPEYIISYYISNTNNSFEKVIVDIYNTEEPSKSLSENNSNSRGNIRYLSDTGQNDYYEITSKVIYTDKNGNEYIAAQSTVSDTADAINPNRNDDMSKSSSPYFDSITIIDDTKVNSDDPEFDIDYDITQTFNFQKIEGHAISRGSGDKESKTKNNANAAMSPLKLGNGANTEFKVTALIFDNDGVVVDDFTIFDEADGNGTYSK